MTATMNSLIDTFHKSLGPLQISTTLPTLEGEESVVVGQQVRKSNIGYDCLTIIRSIMGRRNEEVGFFFEAEFDEEFRMWSVFWADSRSIMAYRQFGDVVVFDSTYRTNTFSLPFVSFTGVNHHRKPTLFGCALLADETEKTFIWLFETWLKAMGGKKPVSIITDQDSAMGKAIHKVLSGTQHRYCMWHIDQDEIKHLNQLKMNYKYFEVDYDHCKYSHTIEKFEARWSELIQKYNLKENSWLESMYKVRERWIPCYLRDIFFAGMTTSQHCETRNAFFDGYLNAMTPLTEFLRQYDIAVKHRRDQEKDDDHLTLYTKPALWSKSRIESQASRVYTRNIFYKFQEEYKNMDIYIAKNVEQGGPISIYSLMMDDENNLRRYTVSIDESNGSVSCSCNKFEFEGILCAHIFTIYRMTNVREIPSKYILKRWTIEARYAHICPLEEESSDPNSVTSMMVLNLREATLKCFQLGLQSVEHYKVAMLVLRSIVEEIDNIKLSPKESESVHKDNASHIGGSIPLTEQIQIWDPEHSITKGRSKNVKRIHSSMKDSQVQAKQRMCGYCKRKGHYITTCPDKKIMSVEAAAESQVVLSQISKMMGGSQISGMEESQAQAKQRMCGYCKRKGHYITTCPKKKTMGAEAAAESQAVLSQMSEMMGGSQS